MLLGINATLDELHRPLPEVLDPAAAAAAAMCDSAVVVI